MGESRSYSQKVISASTFEARGKRKVADESIVLNSEDLKEIIMPHEDPLIIEADMIIEADNGPTSTVTKLMVDIESSMDIIYLETIKRMGHTKEDLSLPKEPSTISPIELLRWWESSISPFL